MIRQIIEDAKLKFAEDYKSDENLDDEIRAFEEGMITAFDVMFDKSLRSSISFELVEGESVSI